MWLQYSLHDRCGTHVLAACISFNLESGSDFSNPQIRLRRLERTKIAASAAIRSVASPGGVQLCSRSTKKMV